MNDIYAISNGIEIRAEIKNEPIIDKNFNTCYTVMLIESVVIFVLCVLIWGIQKTKRKK